MDLVALLLVFGVGYVAGRLTGWLAGIAAAAALALFLLGIAAPASITGVVDSVLREFYYGNELLFLSGFLFGVSSDRAAVKRTRRAVSRRRD